MVTQIDLHPDAEIGPGLLIAHGGSIRVHGATKIGADCALHHVCTIGAGLQPGGATIGDHVFIGCHSSIIGAVTIGDGAMIAANSLVITNVPASRQSVSLRGCYRKYRRGIAARLRGACGSCSEAHAGDLVLGVIEAR